MMTYAKFEVIAKLLIMCTRGSYPFATRSRSLFLLVSYFYSPGYPFLGVLILPVVSRASTTSTLLYSFRGQARAPPGTGTAPARDPQLPLPCSSPYPPVCSYPYVPLPQPRPPADAAVQPSSSWPARGGALREAPPRREIRGAPREPRLLLRLQPTRISPR